MIKINEKRPLKYIIAREAIWEDGCVTKIIERVVCSIVEAEHYVREHSDDPYGPYEEDEDIESIYFVLYEILDSGEVKFVSRTEIM